SRLFDYLVEARDFFPGFAARVQELSGQDLHVRYDGMLVANFTAEEERHAVDAAAWQRAAGLAAELLDGEGARALEPGLDPAVASWLWLPSEGQVDSQLLARALPHALSAAGIRSISGRRVSAVVASGGRCVGMRLEDGRTLESDVVVLAAGAAAGTLQGLPRAVPVHPVRGHMLRFPVGVPAPGRLVASHDARYLVPRADGSMLAGSTMEEAGFDRSLSEEALRTIHQGAVHLIPSLAAWRPAEQWAELRPISADNLPILGPDPDLAGLFYAAGYGRNGILMGPLAGRLVARLIAGEDVAGWEAWGIGRFGSSPQ
ncbi:MAG TPA: FAD-dependent oxidoreductase, partial [Longimicrobiales bacterium]